MVNRLLFAFLFLLTSYAFGQCPTSDIVLASQAEVDDFFTLYPSCTALDVNLSIGDPLVESDITDLSPLNGIISVNGAVEIVNNPLLENLDGLETLTTIPVGAGDLYISDNPMLNNIQGLSGLSGSVGRNIFIQNNPSLVNLVGLGNVSGPGDDDLILINNDLLVDLTGLEGMQFADDIVINENENFLNLNGFDNFESTGSIILRSNPNLVSLDGMPNLFQFFSFVITDNVLLTDLTELEGVNFEGDAVDIRGNLSLSTCNLDWLCDLLYEFDSSPDIIIENNAPGCDSREEVEDSCAVCPTAPVILTSQAEVDAFADNYRFCSEFDFGLTIAGSDITDLSGLAQIAVMRSELRFEDNPILSNFDGLNPIVLDGGGLTVLNNASLLSVSEFSGSALNFGLVFFNNANLNDMSGVSGVTEVFDLFIDANPQLATLSGLEGLTQVFGILQIRNTPLISDLLPLSNLSGEIEELVVINNDLLTDLSGLEGLTAITSTGINIRDNDGLTSLNGLENITNETVMPLFPLNILNNSSLVDISAINNINPNAVGGLGILDNPNLAVCNNEFVCGYLETGMSVAINNNAPASNCETFEAVLESCGLSVSEFDFSTISLSPNPTEGVFSIHGTDGSNLIEVQLYSLSGQKLMQFNSTVVDVSGLAAGIYFVQIKTDAGIAVKRLIKQ
ncbi:T9SS type A sorting domain-containing protein [Gilvibacter sp.]|uniref:T9SS type A sorting domain-containing protein n=1 Tax=Gilvibacter sp. TaxID=2729997 RepID=UPI003B51987E